MPRLFALAATAAIGLTAVAHGQFGQSSTGKTIAVGVGKRATISLASNPSTGYHWVVVTRPDTHVAKLVASRYVAPANGAPPIVGAPGKQVYVIRGLHSGTTRFAAHYVAPGRTAKIGKRFAVRIRVR
jgi:inhibitor of cysteine peptidase